VRQWLRWQSTLQYLTCLHLEHFWRAPPEEPLLLPHAAHVLACDADD
jgi:hypothetical protein